MTSSLESMPRDLQLHALSFCDKQTLATVPQLSHYWRILTGDDALWSCLFNLRFHEEMPQLNRCFVAYAKRANPICIQNLGQLENRVIDFWCNLKWDVKRQFSCSFPQNNSYFVNTQMSFGPTRGTLEGFQRPADEVDYFQFLGDVSPPAPETTLPGGVAPFKVGPGQSSCPSDLLVNGERKGIPYSVSVDWAWPDNLIEGPLFLKLFYASNTTEKITGVDVGYGNTLGFFSEINDWKSPYKLFCTRGQNGEPVWGGIIPTYKPFKFVLITPQNNIIWENGNHLELWENNSFVCFKNRIIRIYASYHNRPREDELELQFSTCPIEFPKP